MKAYGLTLLEIMDEFNHTTSCPALTYIRTHHFCNTHQHLCNYLRPVWVPGFRRIDPTLTLACRKSRPILRFVCFEKSSLGSGPMSLMSYDNKPTSQTTETL